MQLCLGRSAESEFSLQEQIRAAAGARFRCLDLSLPALDDYLASYPSVVLVTLLQQHELDVGMVSGLSPLALSEAAAPRRASATTRFSEALLLLRARLLALCADLDTLGGATVLLPLSSPSSADETLHSALERVLRTLADVTAPFEVRLALTPLLEGDDAAAALAGTAAAVERAGRPNLGLGLDLAGSSLPDEIPTSFARRLWAVRLGAMAWRQERQSQLRALCAQLASVDYRGPYSIAPRPGASSLVEGARAAKEALHALRLSSDH